MLGDKLTCANGEHCGVMTLMLDSPDENRRGFSGVHIISLRDGEMRYIGVRYCKTSKRADKGIMLNFCPFCGASIQWWVK